MAEETVACGIVGAGLMGRELASAVARWVHLDDLGVRPGSSTCATRTRRCSRWYERLDPPPALVDRLPRAARPTTRVDAVYCAVPHHLHRSSTSTSCAPAATCWPRSRSGSTWRRAGDRRGGRGAPGAARPLLLRVPVLARAARRSGAGSPSGRVGRVIEVRAAFLHSSDLDPRKPINWKRRAQPERRVRLHGRPGHARRCTCRCAPAGGRDRCARCSATSFPSVPTAAAAPSRATRGTTRCCSAWPTTAASRSRCCSRRSGSRPGETNTWSIEVDGMEGSIAYSTKLPKTLRRMEYSRGGPQAWSVAGPRVARGLPDDHRRDLRDGLLGLAAADARRLPRRGGPRP